jgi:hypothetical protein
MQRQKGVEQMKPPEELIKIVDKTRYDVSKSTLIAGDDFWDGHNWERNGRNTFLYRTPKGYYFEVTLTRWQGERDSLTPVPLDQAISDYEHSLPEHRIPYEQAFSGVEVKDA